MILHAPKKLRKNAYYALPVKTNIPAAEVGEPGAKDQRHTGQKTRDKMNINLKWRHPSGHDTSNNQTSTGVDQLHIK